ncbi:DUF3558 family protein [Nocardia sp. NPDC050718]|uniref:DUF3558 family protein n=1 Tax=Nocardia sp. NPDC050718 TaxID=3155788 RepID=UPI0033D51117
MFTTSRPSLIALCALAFASGCSTGNSGMPGSAVPEDRSYASLPSSCAEVDVAARESLVQFAGYLEKPETRLQSLDTGSPLGADELICTVSFDADPVPAGEFMPKAGPLLRTVTINLDRGPVVPGEYRTTRPPMASDAPERKGFGTPRQLDGIGDDAMLRVEDNAGTMRSWATAVVDNIRIEVITSGMDWSGGSTPPVWSSPTMRDGLSSGAEAILAELARELPPTLPTATSEPATRPATSTSTARQEVNQPVWDPCSIPESAIAEARLQPATEQTGEEGKGSRCAWKGDGYTLAIESTDEAFHAVYYSHYGWYPTPRPAKVRDRQALLVAKSFGGADHDVDDGYCELGFDTPFGTKNGIPVGRVGIELWDDNDRKPNAVCKDLVSIAELLVAHLPPSR